MGALAKKTLWRTELYNLRTNTLDKRSVAGVDALDVLTRLTNGLCHYAERVTETPDLVYVRGVGGDTLCIVYERLPSDVSQ